MTITTDTRNADLADLADLLKDQHARKVDFVAPATAMRMRDGILTVRGTEPEITPDGVTLADGSYRPSAGFDGQLAGTLDVPVKYLRRLRADRPDLYDATVNGLFHGRTRRNADGTVEVIHEADARSFLIRAFRDDDGGIGYGRAILSNRYRVIDNLDVLTAVLEGVKDSGVRAEIVSCDLTDSNMHVRIAAPEVIAYAPALLAGYRNPFDGNAERAGLMAQGAALAAREGQGYAPGTEPIVFAGFSVRNSETGGGRFTITPVLTVQVCRNGLVITQDVLAKTHLGGRMDDGIVRWGQDTQAKSLELVTLQARDAVKTFLDVDYVTDKVAAIDAKAGARVTDPAATVERVASTLKFDAATTAGVLDHFITGGQITAGGLLNAVTSYAQTVPDADDAWDIEAAALRVLDLV